MYGCLVSYDFRQHVDYRAMCNNASISSSVSLSARPGISLSNSCSLLLPTLGHRCIANLLGLLVCLGCFYPRYLEYVANITACIPGNVLAL